MQNKLDELNRAVVAAGWAEGDNRHGAKFAAIEILAAIVARQQDRIEQLERRIEKIDNEQKASRAAMAYGGI
jgi:hypothetical protein